MKNNLEAGSRKVRRSDNTICTRLTPGRIIVGVLASTLLLFSLIGTIVVVASPHAIAATVSLAANSVAKHTLAFTDTSTPTTTTTSTPSPTPTDTPTPTTTTTSTPTPTTTTTSTPSPTSTSTPSPTATRTSTPSPTSTSPASSTPSLTPTRGSTTTPVASATAGATSTVTAVVTQSSGQDQTPTTSTTSNTIQSTSRDQQNGDFPFIALEIGLPGSAAALFFLFIGWWLLRKRLLPVKKFKLPPSGAVPWSRVRTSDTPWNLNTNGSMQPNTTWSNLNNGSSAPSNGAFSSPTGTFAPNNGSFFTTNNGLIPMSRESNSSPSHRNGIAPTGTPSNMNFGPPNNAVSPTPSGFVQTNSHNDSASTGQPSFSGIHQIHNAPAMPAPGKPEANRPQAMGNNGNNGYEVDADAYEQWLRNNPGETPDINDPYLKELIRQFSDKSRAARQQKMVSARDGQANSTLNDASWLR